VTPLREGRPRSAVESLFFSEALEMCVRVRSKTLLNMGRKVAMHAATIPIPGSIVLAIAMVDAFEKNVVASWSPECRSLM